MGLAERSEAVYLKQRLETVKRRRVGWWLLPLTLAGFLGAWSLVIRLGDKLSTASFLQKYESSGFKATGIKQLYLLPVNGEWKIYREKYEGL